MGRFVGLTPGVGAFVMLLCLPLLQPCAGFANSSDNGGSRTYPSRCHATTERGYDEAMGRRDVLRGASRTFPVAVAALFTATAPLRRPARALDFEAFESGQISKDSSAASPELSDDEALCKYGAPGKAMGRACERARMKPRLPTDVDATGKVDRGDYLKCRYEYPIVNGEYVKTRVCKPSKEWAP